MYTCNDPVCDPICDFCLFCEHDDGVPVRCTKGNDADFGDGLGYCDDFKCSTHENEA